METLYNEIQDSIVTYGEGVCTALPNCPQHDTHAATPIPGYQFVRFRYCYEHDCRDTVLKRLQNNAVKKQVAVKRKINDLEDLVADANRKLKKEQRVSLIGLRFAGRIMDMVDGELYGALDELRDGVEETDL